MTKGYIHSTESFGTLDGPGVRFVIFMQGCPLRCKFCHNPDTWETDTGTEMTVAELIGEFEKNRGFYKDGGITVTGGEPLLQLDFVTELFCEAKSRGIHTCLDTSGSILNDNVIKLLQQTDLVLLDIKHIDDTKHTELTGHSNKNVLSFAKYLSQKKIPVVIRHVLVPTINDDVESLEKLADFICTLENVHKIEILAYHDMAKSKYESLKILAMPLLQVPVHHP